MSTSESTSETSRRDHQERVQNQFARSVAAYVTSPTHAAGEDLDQLVDWAEGGPDRVALDVATGGGHTALALASRYGIVVATDLTEPMLKAAEAHARERGVSNVEFRLADAEALPFDSATFDLVSCRIAPHHFADVARFVQEVSRVLRSGGLLLLEDSVAPDDAEASGFLNQVEKLRDATHVRTLARLEWLGLIGEVGLSVEQDCIIAKTHPFENWVERANVSEQVKTELRNRFLGAPPSIREALRIVVEQGTVKSYSDQKLLVKARKPTNPLRSER